MLPWGIFNVQGSSGIHSSLTQVKYMYLNTYTYTCVHMPNAHTWTYIFAHVTVQLFVDSVVLLFSKQTFLLLRPKEREATAQRQRETEVVNTWLLCFWEPRPWRLKRFSRVILSLGSFHFMCWLYNLPLRKAPLPIAFSLSGDFYPDQKADFQGHSAGPNPERWSEPGTTDWNQRSPPEVARFSSAPPRGSGSQGCRHHFSLCLWQEAPQAPIHQLPWHHFAENARRPKRREGKPLS